MKILFTGASSFTGYWFVKELVENGHDIWATFTQESVRDYDDVRGERVKRLTDLCRPIWSCAFGSDSFVDHINGERDWDLFCHHAADVRDYKSPDFDFTAALERNTRNVRAVLASLQQRGCNRMVLTGSVFEQNEGAGEEPLRAFSPYGLSKGLTADVFRYWCQMVDMGLGKFVIPNPFGPFEEPRFTAYLANSWLSGKAAGVRTPAYIRDNIHISLMAKSYSFFCEQLMLTGGYRKLNPSGYVESQGAFAQRFADAMRTRFDLPCELELGEQNTFDEPKMRVNTDVLVPSELNWDETKAWDEIADFYLSRHAG